MDMFSSFLNVITVLNIVLMVRSCLVHNFRMKMIRDHIDEYFELPSANTMLFDFTVWNFDKKYRGGDK